MSFSLVLNSAKSVSNNTNINGIFANSAIATSVLSIDTTNAYQATTLQPIKYQISGGSITGQSYFIGSNPQPITGNILASSGSTNGTTLYLDYNVSLASKLYFFSGNSSSIPASFTGVTTQTNATSTITANTLTLGAVPNPALSSGSIYGIGGTGVIDAGFTALPEITNTATANTITLTLASSTALLAGTQYYVVGSGFNAGTFITGLQQNISTGAISTTNFTLDNDITFNAGTTYLLSGVSVVANTTLTGVAPIPSGGNTLTITGTTITFASSLTLTNGVVYSVVGTGILPNTTITGTGTGSLTYTCSISQTIATATSYILYQRTFTVSNSQTVANTSITMTPITYTTNTSQTVGTAVSITMTPRTYTITGVSQTVASTTITIYPRQYTLSASQPTQNLGVVYQSPSTYTVNGTTTQSATSISYTTFQLATNQLKYFFDWSQILKFKGLQSKSQAYKMTFSFQSIGMTTSANSFIYIQLQDLGISEYQIDLQGYNSNYNGIIGYCYPNAVGSNNYIQSQFQTNPAVYLNYLPTQNNFTVELRTIIDGTLSDSFTYNSNYILILNFEEV